MVVNTPLPDPGTADNGRRDFLYLATTAVGLVGAGAAAWTLIDSMSPSADVEVPLEIDLSSIERGQAITVVWRGKPVFIRHRTDAEIRAARATNIDNLRHPESDADRVQKPEWIVVIGICPYRGCLPKGQRTGELKGDYGGWFCPCGASHFDTSGRVRKGLAPTNLPIPPYRFPDDRTIAIGSCFSPATLLPCGSPGHPLPGGREWPSA